jgi:hypothetical protein
VGLGGRRGPGVFRSPLPISLGSSSITRSRLYNRCGFAETSRSWADRRVAASAMLSPSAADSSSLRARTMAESAEGERR